MHVNTYIAKQRAYKFSLICYFHAYFVTTRIIKEKNYKLILDKETYHECISLH